MANAGMRSKVVTLEEVVPQPLSPSGVHFSDESYLQPDLQTGTPGTVKTDDTALSKLVTDVVYKLPEDWPNIPQLLRTRSCAVTNAKSPCVNKAVSHLELLQTIIEEWFRGELSRASTRQETRSSEDDAKSKGSSLGRRQIRFMSSSSDRRHISVSAASRHTSDSSRTGSELSIHGVGGTSDHKVSKSPKEDVLVEIPYLGAEEVIDEVLTLIARLETDRIEAEKAYKNEKERVKALSARIDKLMMRRMFELPRFVQREHEACAMDIGELKWHVAYRGRAEERMKRKFDKAELLNSRLHEDIDFIKKHCPLVEEKLSLEKEAMEQIALAQNQTSQELDTTLKRCSDINAKAQDNLKKANAERNLIKRDLDGVRDDLQQICAELTGAENTNSRYITLCSDYRQKIVENKQETLICEVRKENMKAAEAMQLEKVTDLSHRLERAEMEERRLDEENLQLMSDMEVLKDHNEGEERQLTRAREKTEDKYKEISRTNQEFEMEIEDFTRKIKDCERQKVADAKNMRRMNKEMENTEEQLAVTLDELGQVVAINTTLKDKLERETEKCSQTEDALRTTVDSLKRQVKEEIHTKTLIGARIQSDSNEIEKTERETEEKKTKINKRAADVKKAVEELEKKVVALRAAHAERTKIITELKKQNANLKKKHQEVEKKLTEEREGIRPYHTQLTNDLAALNKKLDHMAYRTDMMLKKLEDIDGSERMMNRLVDTTQKAISELIALMKELTIQLEQGIQIEDDLKMALEQITGRIQSRSNSHTKQMRERNLLFENIQEDLKCYVIENKDLASRYRQLQNEFVIKKNKLLNRYDEKEKLENTIKDIKQLQSLQQRLHISLQDYYKLRGAYNKGELARMNQESGKNSAKISILQDQMSTALDKITDFLQNQMDVDAVRKSAMASMRREATQSESVAVS